jgi:hypothetical protein
MYFSKQNKPLGLLLIILGLAVLIAAAGTLLLRIAVAIVALMIINYGMRLYGMPLGPMFTRMWLYRSMR